MSTGLIIVLAIAILLLLYAVAMYNNLIRLKHGVARAWSNIDVLLKQRHDELPQLVSVCQAYMRHEQETLARIVRARALVRGASDRHDTRALGSAETALRAGVDRVMALAEHYPDLKADRQFQQLSRRISQLEDSIADRRELYNESANLNNTRIEQFPDALIARLFSFKPVEPLEFATARAVPDLSLLLRGR